MKKIEAIIRPEKLDAVRLGLEKIGIVGMNVTNVQGRGRQKGICLQWRAGEYCVEFLQKVQLDIILDNKDLEKVIDEICKAARTGKPGDGKIFVYNVEDVIRVGSGERGINAI